MSASGMRQLVTTDANRDVDTIDVAAFEYNVEDYGVSNLTSEFFPLTTPASGLLEQRKCRSWSLGILDLGDWRYSEQIVYRIIKIDQ